jgi:hypothetical protein
MRMRVGAISVLLIAAAAVWTVPLLGLAVAGTPIAGYLAFPPHTTFVPHAPFQWGWFVMLSLPVVGAAALYWIAIAGARPETAALPQSRFPWWGWLGLALGAGGWFLAWHEGTLPSEWRRHAFTPLWLGYVLAMNGLVFRRVGRALLTHRTGWFIALFPASVAFWWLFEHLNQFVGNWYYTGAIARSEWDYFVQASLPFSTVLPAVASTWVWLRQIPRLDAIALPALRGHATFARLVLPAGLFALGCVGIWPETLFPVLWVAPLLVLWALQELLLGETLLTPLQHGDWRPLLQPALAALICGLLWELWNFGSVAKWHYSIPYVQRFSVFEMPLLGYAGYLPFGIECALVMDLIARNRERRALWPLAP